MCPLRVILIFLSASLAGFFMLRGLRSQGDEEPAEVTGGENSLSLSGKVGGRETGKLQDSDFFVSFDLACIVSLSCFSLFFTGDFAAGSICDEFRVLDVRGHGEWAISVEEPGVVAGGGGFGKEDLILGGVECCFVAN
ncbi:hypothetical protein KFK09_006761 [Dendrobium nobile]|uniref:Secreted protein n=1 Tax=Dendrobium nobile TaxID=94219 RepID=A0A8T3BSG8_DENNO|nr:hypothetical protein KFK09_006761 [Dendrobium nobile]